MREVMKNVVRRARQGSSNDVDRASMCAAQQGAVALEHLHAADLVLLRQFDLVLDLQGRRNRD